MGKYTTELKTICESIVLNKTSLTIDELLQDPAYKYKYKGSQYTPYEIVQHPQVHFRIFTGIEHRILYPIFDESYRGTLQRKILLHYYTREICEETFGLWKLRLISKLNDIMPYYNQLYTETFEKYLGSNYNLFDNINITTTDDFDKKIERIVESVLNEQMKSKNSGSSSATESNDGKDITKYKKKYRHTLGGAGYEDGYGEGKVTMTSDTPQSSINPMDNGYLTQVVRENGTIIQRNYNSGLSKDEEYRDEDGSSDEINYGREVNTSNVANENGQRNVNTSNSENEQAKEKRSNTKIVSGKNNHQTYANILKEIRENIINVDKMIIDELEPLFIGLW